MNSLVLTATMMLAALGVAAEGLPQAMGNDALTQQILRKATFDKNGGVTAAFGLGSGQAIKYDYSEARALAPLAPAKGLTAKVSAKPKTKKPSRRAANQLKSISVHASKGWGEKR